MARSSGFSPRFRRMPIWLTMSLTVTIRTGRCRASVTAFSRRPVSIGGCRWRKVGRLTQIVEPIVSVIHTPDGKNTDRMPNEDSVSSNSMTPAFFQNRFGGIDRVEGGPRINYGLNSGFFGLSGGFSSFFIGQSYRLDESDDFGSDSGLDEHFSDVVGRIRVRPARYVDALYPSASTRTISLPGETNLQRRWVYRFCG